MAGMFEEKAAGLLSVEQVSATSLGDAGSPEFTVDGDVDDEGADRYTAETFEHAAILHRPTGNVEAVVWRAGDDVAVLGTKRRADQEEVAEGEVMLRSYGSSAGTILLTPSGGIYLGTGATEFVARADRVEAAIDAMRDAIALSIATSPAGSLAAIKADLAAAISAATGASGTGCDDVRGI